MHALETLELWLPRKFSDLMGLKHVKLLQEAFLSSALFLTTAMPSNPPNNILKYHRPLVPPDISAMQVVPLVTAEVMNCNKASDRSKV